MAFSTTIKKKFWEKKMEDLVEKDYFYEYKSDTEHWRKRIDKLEPPCAGVFLVGNEVHRVTITEILKCHTRYMPEKYVEAITTDECYVLKCYIEDFGVGG